MIDQFYNVVLKSFFGDSSYDVVENFNSLKQGVSTVSEYTDKFEERMSSFKKENPGVPESYYIKCFVNGLRPEINYLNPFKPTTLYDAVETARNMELGVQAQSSKKVYITNNTYQRNTNQQFYFSKPKVGDVSGVRTKLDKKPTARPETKFREPGTCRYCGDK